MKYLNYAADGGASLSLFNRGDVGARGIASATTGEIFSDRAVVDPAAPQESVGDAAAWMSGLSNAFAQFQSAFATGVFGANLPLVGDTVGSATGFMSDLQASLNAASASFTDTTLSGLDNFLTSFLSGQGVLAERGDAGTDDDVVLIVTLNDDTVVTLNPLQYDSVDLNEVKDLRIDLGIGRTGESVAGLLFDLGLAGLGLDFESNAELDGTFDWNIDLSFGFDLESNDFYLVTGNGAEIQITNAVFELPEGFAGVARMGLFDLLLEENAGGVSTGLNGSASVNFIAQTAGETGRLFSADLATILTGAEITYNLAVAADLSATLAMDFVSNGVGGFAAQGNFPTLSADVTLNWLISSTPADPLGAPPVFALNNITLDFDEAVGEFLLPILEQIDQTFAPIWPILDYLTNPVPILSDAPGFETATYLDLITLFGGDVDGFDELIGSLQGLRQLLESAQSSIASGQINLGDLDFSGLDLRAPGALDSPDLGALFASLATTQDIRQQVEAITGAPGGFGGDDLSGLATATSGFSLPFLDDPASLMGMLFGVQADLIRYDAPLLQFAFDWSTGNIGPVLPPLPVFIRFDGGFEFIVDLSLVYDTTGIAAYLESGEIDDLLLGLYIDDNVTTGPSGTVDAPEVSFSGFIGLSGLISAFGIVEGGVTGAIVANVFGDLVDLDGDGRIRGDEIAQLLVDSDPFDLFTFTGSLNATVDAFATLDLLFWERTEVWNLWSQTLLDLSAQNLPSLELATLQSDGVLRLNVGAFASARGAGQTDIGEQYRVEAVAPGVVRVSAFGISRIYGDPDGVAVVAIIADAGAGADLIVLDDDLIALGGGAITATLSGGSGADTIQGGGGGDLLDGGAGDDLLFGGGGDDVIDGGSGVDLALGQDGEDRIVLRDGTDRVDGGAGSDVVDLSTSTSGGAANLATGEFTGGFVGTPGFASNMLQLTLANGGLDDLDPAVARVGSGFVLVWQSEVSGGTYDVVGRLYDATGTPITGEFSVSGGAFSGDQISPDVAALSTGGFVVAFSSNDTHVYITRFDSNGSQVGSRIEIAPTNPGFDPLHPTVAAFPSGIGRDGWFVVVYEAETLSRETDILARIYNASGGLVTTFTVSNESDGQTRPDVAILPNGTIVFTYVDETNDSNTDNAVVVRSFDSSGTPLTAELNVTGASGLQGEPQVVALAGGRFAIAWTEPTGSQSDIYMRVFSSTSTALAEIVVPTQTGGAQNEPTLVALADGGFIVFWDEDSGTGPGGQNQLRGQRFDANGVRVGDVFQALVSGEERRPSAIELSNGQIVLVFDENLGGDIDLRAQIYDPARAIVTSEISNFIGSAFADVLTGNGASNALTGAAGADVLDGAEGDDLLSGGDDADMLFGSAGNDLLDGGNHDDQLFGGDNADLLFGRAGNDTLDGGAGANTLEGGAGDDVYYVRGASDVVVELSGAGIDTLISTATRTLGDFQENLTLIGAAEINGFGNILANTIIGNDAVNIINGAAGADVLSGNGGQDTLNGGNGADSLDGGADDDLLDGGNDADMLNGGDGDDTLYGRTANDVLSGDAGNDTIYGGDGGDTASGGDGDDLIDGLNNDDVLSGGDGADQLYGRQNNDTLNGDAGNDTLYGGDGADTLSGGGDNDLLDGGNGDDALAGGDGADTLYGRQNNDTLAGDAGNDTLYGGDGDDNLSGGDGADVLEGGNGIDRLNGGLGADSLWGGTGADTYVFDSALGAGNVDTVLYFNVAQDFIELSVSIFGSLSGDFLVIGSAAASADHRIVYDATTGALYFDADGDGAGAAVQFATLATGLFGLSESNFLGGP